MIVRVNRAITIFASGDADSREYLPAHPGAVQLGGNHVGGGRRRHQIGDSVYNPVPMQAQIKDGPVTRHALRAVRRDLVETK